MLTPTQIHQAAALLVEARWNQTKLADLPVELRPQSAQEAYAIQYAVARQLGPIRGWKVSLASGDPKATPICAPHVLASGQRWKGTGAHRVEVELAMKMARALPRRSSPYGADEVLASIQAAHIAFEFLGSRFIDRKQVSALTGLADGQSNAALVVGGEIPGWRQLDLSRLNMTLCVDGAATANGGAGTSLEGILQGLTWLANHAIEHTVGLEAGHVILTGARLGPVQVPAQCQVEAHAQESAVVNAMLE